MKRVIQHSIDLTPKRGKRLPIVLQGIYNSFPRNMASTRARMYVPVVLTAPNRKSNIYISSFPALHVNLVPPPRFFPIVCRNPRLSGNYPRKPHFLVVHAFLQSHGTVFDGYQLQKRLGSNSPSSISCNTWAGSMISSSPLSQLERNGPSAP